MFTWNRQDKDVRCLSSSVLTWSKELDLSFQPKLEVELTIFTNPWLWTSGLVRLEFYGIIPKAPWRIRELLVSPSKQGWAGGLGLQSLPHEPKGEQPQSLPAWCSLQIPSLRQRDQHTGQFLPASSCPGGASDLTVTLLPLLLPVRLQVASSSGTYQLPPTMCNFLFSVHAKFFFYQQATMERQVHRKKSVPEQKCCGF